MIRSVFQSAASVRPPVRSSPLKQNTQNVSKETVLPPITRMTTRSSPRRQPAVDCPSVSNPTPTASQPNPLQDIDMTFDPHKGGCSLTTQHFWVYFELKVNVSITEINTNLIDFFVYFTFRVYSMNSPLTWLALFYLYRSDGWWWIVGWSHVIRQ